MGLKFQFLLHKAYFDKGYGWTNYFKYGLAFVGIFDMINARIAVYSVVGYLLICYFLGRALFKYGWVDVENEVQNTFNPFVGDMRRSIRYTEQPKGIKRK